MMMRVACGPLLAACVGACTENEPTTGRFEQTGELIALSGGDAGATGACITCHGTQGEGNGGDAPRLAGLDAGYIVRQMDYFASGLRRHPQMVWIADHTDRPARVRVAAYYAALPVPERVPGTGPLGQGGCTPAIARLYHEGDSGRGIESCASCHEESGEGVGTGNPPLAGQPATYLAGQLRLWREGKRYGDPLDSMTHVSRLLSERELEPLAGYSSALRGATRYPALPEACLSERRPDPKSGA
ncbi:conserved hypothetical protein [Altererythrobacter sp. B11]|uniref:c-type cytochrome n=1 Tax=Altererythrobacter sp. B11 TaxID=2060312 RepID=UPI000DC6EC66|nr:c-type cytochrome [Altererythrobacter sp. B11]BBC72791.1 conserved hypothetical protein [Altererythrobacter sp. B11]